MMKIIRYTAWALVLIVAAALTYTQLTRDSGRDLLEVADAQFGGPFNLVRHDGQPISEQDLLGKPHAIFFGFTHCPEICPTTLFEARGWVERLGADADDFSIYFFTVDPERDTPEFLSEYLSSFDDTVTGITGSVEDMQNAMKLYRVYAKKVPLDDGDYTMDHTATVYLMDSDGKFSGTVSWGEDPDTAFEKVRRLVEKG